MGDCVVIRELVGKIRQVGEVERIIEVQWQRLRLNLARGGRGKRGWVRHIFIFIDVA